MIALGRGIVTCLLATLLAGCGKLPAIFEDVGDDPHPPELTLIGLAPQPPGDPPTQPAFLPPDTVVTIRPLDTAGNRLSLLVSFQDAGADIDTITVRDLGILPGGDGGQTLATVRRPDAGAARGAGAEADGDGEIPLGTTGRVWMIVNFPLSVQGLHTLEMWAEDLNLSRSEKIRFRVNVQIF